MTLYLSARIFSDVQTACRFCHTLGHCVFGYKVSILISFVPPHACAILCNVRYMCCRSFTIVSCVLPCWLYAMSRAYAWRYSSFSRTFLSCGGFFCSPMSCHFRSHSAVIVPSFRPCVYMRHSSSALHFASMCVISHPPMFLGCCSVVMGTLNSTPFHIYHVIAAVIRCIYVLGAGNI